MVDEAQQSLITGEIFTPKSAALLEKDPFSIEVNYHKPNNPNPHNSDFLHFLPPLTNANYSLFSKVLQEKRQEEDVLNHQRVENVQISKFMSEELPNNTTYRMPAHFSEEYVKYLKKRVVDRLTDEETNPINEYIRLHLKEDKRFSKETNDYIKRELSKRVHELKLILYQKMEKKRENSLGIFDSEANKVRVRSLFKIEMQKLAESVHLIHKEIVSELEEKHKISHHEDDKFLYSREGRIIRKSADFVEHLRASEAHKQNANDDLKRSHSFLPSTPTTTTTTTPIHSARLQSARPTNQGTWPSSRSTKSDSSITKKNSTEDLLNKNKP